MYINKSLFEPSGFFTNKDETEALGLKHEIDTKLTQIKSPRKTRSKINSD